VVVFNGGLNSVDYQAPKAKLIFDEEVTILIAIIIDFLSTILDILKCLHIFVSIKHSEVWNNLKKLHNGSL